MDTSNHPGGEGLYNYFTRNGTEVPPSKEEFSLEEILAEYGGSLEDQLLREAEETIAGQDQPKENPPADTEQTENSEKKPSAPLKRTWNFGKRPSEEKQEHNKDSASSTTETPADSETGTTETPADSETGTTETPADSETGTTETPADSKTDTTETPADSETGTTATPADSETGTTETPTDSKAGATETPADFKPEIPHTGMAAAIHEDPIQAAEAAAAIDVEKLDLPDSPHPISLEEVVNSTIEAVMEEGRQEPIKPQKRRSLFSRKPLEDSERLPPPPEPEPEYDPEPIGPEPDMQDAARASRNVFLKRKKPRLLQLLPGLLPTVLLLAEERGLTVPYWTGDVKVQTILLLGCLIITALLCRQVFARAFEMVRQRRVVSELLVCFSVLAAAADCVVRLSGTERTDAMPYASVTCLGLVFAQWGVRRESRGTFDMFRCAAMDDRPPYLVTDTLRGACKQRGSVPGFFTVAMRDDFSTKLQTAFLPLFGMGAIVFAGLCSFGQERSGDFFLNLSAILPAAATFSLPLSWSLPWSKLAERLQKNGAAVAGWSGAQKISRRRTMIVTDSDLFPPGTLQENGQKFYGEEPIKAIAYAASMAKSAGCGLEFFFRNLLRAENGRYEDVDEFSFYEEGGYSGVIHGESVLMGSHSFMRKMEIRLPGDVHLRNGVFLAVDRHLIAIFAVKYNPAENVDFALKLMRRCHVMPILASRDPNITPALLRQKFGRAVKPEFPDLSERVALSEAEKDRGLPRALLFREGLLPYAETVAGSQRLCGAVRGAAILSLAGSFFGTLLAFYMLYLSAYSLLNPLALEIFLLLWTLPVLLISKEITD